MKIYLALLLLIFTTYLHAQTPAPTSGRFIIYKLQSGYVSGLPSSVGPSSTDGIAIIDSSGVLIKKVTTASLGLPSGTINILPKFTSSTALGNSTLIDSAGFIGIGQLSGLQNARLNITTQSSSSSTMAAIFTNSGGTPFAQIKNTGSFIFGVSTAMNWDETTAKLTFNSPTQLGTSTNQPFYFIVNGNIETALDPNSFTVNVPVDNTATSFTGLARGTTAQRPTATFSRIRAITDTPGIEYADGTTWQLIASRNWVRSNFGNPTTIYTGDGRFTANRTVSGANNNLTFDSINNLKINAATYIYQKQDATFPYTAAILGAANNWQYAYTPAATVFSKGNAITIDTNNNVSLGSSIMSTTMPLYSTGGNGFLTNLLSGGGNFYRVDSIVTSSNLTTSQYFIRVDASGGAVTLTLPAASTVFGGNVGILYKIQKIDASGNAVTISRSGANTINGATSQTISTQYDIHEVQCTSTTTWAYK